MVHSTVRVELNGCQWFGFVPLPAEVMGALALVTIVYLISVYVVKRWFFAHYQLS
jgi:hypothetical protein